MMTMNAGIRTLSGMIFFINDITILEHINTNIVARPIPIPFSAEVVVPNVGHIPNKRTKVGFSLVIPLSIIFNLFIFSPPYFDLL